MDTTKVYANMLAVQSGKRLDAERLRRVIEARSLDDAFKMLGDYGFAYTEGCTVDGFVVEQANELAEFVAECAPSEALKRALTARFAYNNAKLAYKSRFHEVPSDGYYRISFDADSIAAGDYSNVEDKYMVSALEMLDESKESRPQAIDLALTRAMYKSVLACNIRIVKKYFRAELDMKNILSAARMRRLNITADEFIGGGSVGIDVLEQSVKSSAFAECFERTRYFCYAERIEQAERKELWRAELDADDYLFYLTDSDVIAFSSYTPFINYYTDALIELKTIKTALVCVKTGSRDEFYSRLPARFAE